MCISLYSKRIAALVLPLTTIALCTIPTTTSAQVTSWIGQGPETEFENSNLWTNGVPNANTIAAVGPHQSANDSNVLMNQDHSLGGLLITDGMGFFNGTSHLTVGNVNAGGLTVAGEGSTLNVWGNTDGLLDATINGKFNVQGGASLLLRDQAWIEFNEAVTIDADSQVFGDGFLLLRETLLNNNGLIRTTTGNQISIGASDANFASGIDLDGSLESGALRTATGSRLTIDGNLSDAFDGSLEIGADSEIAFGIFTPQFGAATIDFQGGLDAPGSLSLFGQSEFQSHQLLLNASGHGSILGTAFENGATMLIGRGRILVEENGSLTFGEDRVNLEVSYTGASWRVEDGGVLEFNDTLVVATGNEVRLDGGTVKGDDSNMFFNDNTFGIRGHGVFALPLSNSTVIAADGGQLVVDGAGSDTDWDGEFNNGQLIAEAGDLRLVDSLPGNTLGNVRVGGGQTLQVDSFTMTFAGGVLLNGGTIASERLQRFGGTVNVTRLSTMDSFVAFEDGVVVSLEQDLMLTGHEAFHDGTALFTGTADLINEADNRLRAVAGASFGVDVINHGILRGENPEGPGVVTFAQDLENLGTIVFDLGGNQFGDYSHFDVSGVLLADDGTFQVRLFNDFDPMLGDEFDVLDFGSFVDNGVLFDLPELQHGLAWDSSDFRSQGVLRITAVPEPSSILLVGMGILGVIGFHRRD